MVKRNDTVAIIIICFTVVFSLFFFLTLKTMRKSEGHTPDLSLEDRILGRILEDRTLALILDDLTLDPVTAEHTLGQMTGEHTHDRRMKEGHILGIDSGKARPKRRRLGLEEYMYIRNYRSTASQKKAK
ncbi:hypothetical protein H2200_006482 [Cladophialophora chaetospira]|uniref:Uncharacterized protein n=1 Tax=Cladophialophora chaetospira TaxID=386627 RepID=A0AA39CHZ2_9EURO|nr:hypothetical protein H2200_006482 [Cladophialophora chaetospira]